jgi:peptidoglycan hydrolase-like protein with peptidoglycan-binding domain
LEAQVPRTLSFGASGIEVIVLQATLNSKPPTSLAPLSVDGIFGPRTQARVREFQKNSSIETDGIVGPLTWGRLLAGRPGPNLPRLYCDNINRRHLASAEIAATGVRSDFAPGIVLAGFPRLPSLPSLPTLPKLRPLKGAPEEAIATTVYGGSIDTSRVSLSDKTGLSNRAFVLGIPNLLGPSIQIMNVGLSPSRDTMIHELAHVWQSQHASSATQFMINAVASQGLAEAANQLAHTTSFSAYGYRPGKGFGEYGAEQIAQQAENGELPILSHMKGVAAGAVDADNETSLKTPRIEDTSSPGVKT